MSLKNSFYRKPASGRWLRKSSKRKQELSVNMISLPLADFRHVTHIGNDVHRDSFGDLSFLKLGHNLLLQSSQSEQNLFRACSAPPKPPRLNLDEADAGDSRDRTTLRKTGISPKRKKCSSLPLLDIDEGEGELEGVAYDHRVPLAGSNGNHSPGRGSLSSGRDADSTVTCTEDTSGHQKDEDCIFSFNLDLGPSILDDVLQVMERLHY